MKSRGSVFAINNIKDKFKTDILAWGALCLLLFVSFCSFYYSDMLSTLDNSVLFIKSIFNGHFFDFYQYSIDNVEASWAANYEIPVYFFVGIWNLPVVLLDVLFNYDYLNSTYALLWCKFGLVVCVCAIFIVVKKIALHFNVSNDKIALARFLYMSSIAVFVPVFVCVQYDCISLLIIVLGIYYYIKDRHAMFILCFIIALPLKSFAIIFLPPLLALKEKKLLKIIRDLGLSLIGLLICRIIYWGNAAYDITMSAQYRTTIEALTGGTIEIGSLDVLFFVLVYCTLVLYCYLYNTDNKCDIDAMAIYSSMVAIGCFVILGFMRTYWIILLAPFMILLIVLNPKHLKINILLETAWGATFVLSMLFMNSVPTKTMNTWIGRFLFRKVYAGDAATRKYESVVDLFEQLGLTDLYPLFASVFLFCLLAFWVINFPKKCNKMGNAEKVEKSVLWFRVGAIFMIIAMYLYVYVATTGVEVVNTMNTSTEKSVIDCDILGEGYNTYIQPISFNENGEVHEITLTFDNPDMTAANMCSVSVAFIDVESGEELFVERLAANRIQTGEEIKLDLGEISVSSSKQYSLELTGIPGVKNRPHYSLYAYGSTNFEELDPVLINGIPQEYCMALKIR